MDEETFWKFIEDAWSVVPEFKDRRLEIAYEDEYPKRPTELGLSLENIVNTKVFSQLEIQLRGFNKEESFNFNKILEKKLYDLDSEVVHNYIDGSDDGFLYNRGFIIGMGKKYYYAVLNKPSSGMLWLSSPYFAYMTRAIHNQLHEATSGGISSFTKGISRETDSNPEGWKE